MSYKYEKDLVKENDYEALIESIEINTLASGRNKLHIMFRIRNDVDQAYGNKVLFKDIWESKEEQGVFNRKQINQLLGTQNVAEGQEFETINEIIKFLEGAPLIIHVGIEFDDYRGEDVNAVVYYKKTKIVPQKVGEEEQKSADPIPAMPEDKAEEKKSEDIGVVGDDLPF